MRTLGLDIGGSLIKLALLERERVVETDTTETRAEGGPRAVLERAASLAREAGAVDSVGVALPGVFDPAARRALLANLPGEWGAVDVEAELERALGQPVSALNDGHAFGLAETRLGAGRGARDVVGVVCGTGVGGAVIVGGRLQLGVGGRAGELGHTVVVPDGPRCNCGNRGCLELYVGARAIARAAGRDGFDEAAAAAKAGDGDARRAVEGAGRLLGVALASVAVLLAPERIVIGGGSVAATGSLLLGAARDEAVRRAGGIAAAEALQIVAAELGPYAGAIGAGLHGAERLSRGRLRR